MRMNGRGAKAERGASRRWMMAVAIMCLVSSLGCSLPNQSEWFFVKFKQPGSSSPIGGGAPSPNLAGGAVPVLRTTRIPIPVATPTASTTG